MDVNSYTTLITAEQLLQIHPNPAGVMVFDCSFDLMDAASGETAFGQAHIPGAVYADLNRNLSDKTGQGINGGRHPLPSPEKFAQWLGASGFSNPMQAVVYDRQGANYCGRLWWMLKWLGHAQVAVLDGGWQAWLAAGGAAASGPAPGLSARSLRAQTQPLGSGKYRIGCVQAGAPWPNPHRCPRHAPLQG